MKKITFKKLVFLPFILCGFLGLSQTTLVATDDSYTWNSNATTNYGTQRLVIGNGTPHIREVYLKFNLSSLPSVNSAKLRLTLESGGETTRNYTAYLVNDSWTNAGVKWSNAPAVIGSAIASGSNVGSTIEFDLTSQVQDHVTAMDNVISIKIVSADTDVASFIYSTDTAVSESDKPSLVVTPTTLSIGDNGFSGINNVVVYPNPATDNLYVKGLEENETTVSIYNTVGQLLKQEVYRSNVDLSTFKAGLYYAKIKNELGQKTVSFLKK